MKESIIALVHAGTEPKKDLHKIPGTVLLDVPVSEIEYYNIADVLEKELTGKEQPAYIIFTSANSIKALLFSCHSQSIADRVRSIPVVTVGNKTKEAAESLGFSVSAVATENSQAGLVSFFSSMEVKCKKILFPASGLAQPHLAVELTQSGYEVTQPAVYTTSCLAAAAFEQTAKKLAECPPDILLFTSPSSFRFFRSLSGEAHLSSPKGAIGNTTAMAIQQRGYKVDYISPVQDIQEFIRGAASFLRNRL